MFSTTNPITAVSAHKSKANSFSLHVRRRAVVQHAETDVGGTSFSSDGSRWAVRGILSRSVETYSTWDWTLLRWSETYDRDVTDILRVQAEIASTLVRGLQLSVAPSLLSQWASAKHNPEAYDPLLMRMANQPRFKRLLRDMKLPG